MDRAGCLFVLALLLVVGVVPTVAGAAERWVAVGEDGRTRHLLALGERRSSSTGGRLCQVKRIFKDGGERAYSLDTLEFDCRQGLYRYQGIVIYDRDDDVMHRFPFTDQFCPVPPGSILSKVRDLACAAP